MVDQSELVSLISLSGWAFYLNDRRGRWPGILNPFFTAEADLLFDPYALFAFLTQIPDCARTPDHN